MHLPLKSLSVAVLALCLVALFASATAREFKPALPGYRFEFPRDHAAHEAYKTEWWYYTGHLQTNDRQRFGYELTFFRIGNNPDDLAENKRWAPKNLYMTHFAVSDESHKEFFHTQKLNRPGPGGKKGRAGALSDRYHVWNENWQVELKDGKHHLTAATPQYTLKLTLTPTKAPVIHGKNGVSQKASCQGCASHYYSLTRMKAEGTLTARGKTQPVTGITWMDQEFGSNQLTDEQTGWDWYSVQLDNNVELMVYLLRRKDGSVERVSGGTLIGPNGKSTHLSLADIEVKATRQWKSPHSQGTYPMGWQLKVPKQGIELTITPAFEDQELYTPWLNTITYWEGSCRVKGVYQGKAVTGDAYVEMTGYAQQFEQKL